MLKRRLMELICVIALVVVLPIGAAQAAQPGSDIDPLFRDYYNRHQGIRVLGYPLTALVEADGYPAQYFEKGRIEDHRRDVSNPRWHYMYGRLTAELIERNAPGSVSATTITYADLRHYTDPAYRTPVPENFTGGALPVHDGMFVPYDPQLRPAPGYVVAPYFWAYITRTSLFPGGWLHDVGLPMSETFTAVTSKQGERRTIFMQAFERTVLTYDMRNPAGWQVERGNIGADAHAAGDIWPN